MTREEESLFPDGLSDEAVTILHDFLQALALAWENHYLLQIRRYHQHQQRPTDPAHPWRSPPPDY